MKYYNKITLFILIIVLSTSLLFGCRENSEEIDNKKTQLYVYNYDGGVGSEWLDSVQKRFEETYKDTSFEPGKMGVQIVPKKTKSGFESLLSTSNNAVFFAQQVYYNQLASQNKILDISDVVKEKDDSGSCIEDMLTEEQKSAFTGYDGKYYVVPHYVLYSGVTYDKDVFEDKKLYLSKKGGYTNYELSFDEDPNLTKLSEGPDGISGTYDDGLPSTLEEFINLCNHMVSVNVIPFVFCGEYQQYVMHLLNALWVAYDGDDFKYNFSLDSGNKKIEYISGFNGDSPIYTQEEINVKNAYKLKAQSGKLYALKFLEQALKNNWFSEISYDESSSHTDTQREYIYSFPDPGKKPIAMLIEGTHWYNESKDILNDAAKKYPAYKDRNFAIMPLPNRYDNSVDCKKNTVCDSNSSFAFISANIKDNAVIVDLAKLFLKFCYTEESLQEFTMITGVSKGVDYKLSDDQYKSMPQFYKSLYDIKSNSDVIYPYSNNNIFLNLQGDFGFAQDTKFWESGSYSMPLFAMKDSGYTSKSYFENWVNFTKQETNWNGKYSRFFGD